MPPHPALPIPAEPGMGHLSDARPDLDRHLREAEAFHGHVCGGIVIGVRMALLGLERIGIRDPKGRDVKDLMVFVEIDRCATDAITSVTGCRPGRRTMKLLDFGKMAATFVNLRTGRACRIASAGRPDPAEAPEDSLLRLRQAPDEALFRVQDVHVPLKPEDLPGRPVRSVPCARCGETVMDGRDVEVEGAFLCRPCAAGMSYCAVRATPEQA